MDSYQEEQRIKGRKILLMDILPEEIMALVKQEMPPEFELLVPDNGTQEAISKLAGEADFLITISQKVSAETIRAGKKLQLIHQWGVGYDKIDVEKARACGIPVARTTGVNSVGVAEHTIMLMIALYRQLVKADQGVRSGVWPKWDLRLNNYELRGKTIGIVGMGAVGRELAKRLKPFEVIVYYHDVFKVSPEEETALGIRGCLPLDELIRTSDVVTLHCPLNRDTRGLMNAERFRSMKKSALLINCARGPIVDEKALYGALTQGEIAGAGLDVFEREPIDPDNPLLKLSNVIFSPHVASATRDTLRLMTQRIFTNMLQIAKGLKVEEKYLVR